MTRLFLSNHNSMEKTMNMKQKRFGTYGLTIVGVIMALAGGSATAAPVIVRPPASPPADVPPPDVAPPPTWQLQGPYYALPAWSQTLPSSSRFLVLANMKGEAVLDRETGLVWDQSPHDLYITWHGAVGACQASTRGGRMGWRLPTLSEVLSLVDLAESNKSSEVLPAGHPFSIEPYQHLLVWTSTDDTDLKETVEQELPRSFRAMSVNLHKPYDPGYGTGEIPTIWPMHKHQSQGAPGNQNLNLKGYPGHFYGMQAWCVRGGQGTEAH